MVVTHLLSFHFPFYICPRMSLELTTLVPSAVKFISGRCLWQLGNTFRLHVLLYVRVDACVCYIIDYIDLFLKNEVDARALVGIGTRTKQWEWLANGTIQM